MSQGNQKPKVYYEENPFIELFGGDSDTVMRMLNTLMDMPSYGYTKKQLAEVSGVSESAVLNNWSNLSKHDLVQEKPGESGRTKYQLNQDSEIVEQLYKFGDAIREFRQERTNLAEYRELEKEEEEE